MMNLFSSFDLIFFSKNWISFFFILYNLFYNLFFINSFNFFFKKVLLNLLDFFYSLKMKSFNKLSNMLFMTLFLFIFTMNFFSVFSYNFAFSSQVSVVLFMSLTLWLSILVFAVTNSLKKFILHFIPEGTPMLLTFILFLIEICSTFIRPLTLLVRLVANILAGHLLMILLSKLVFFFNYTYIFYMILNLVEIFVSIIQAYIFSTMMVLYFSEI